MNISFSSLILYVKQNWDDSMRFRTNKDVVTKSYDVVIIGAGIAGLFLSLELPEDLSIALLSKDTVEVCNSVLAQGGIAVCLGDDDTPQSHFEDTLKAGAGLCDEDAVRTLVTEAADCIHTLCDKYDVVFDKDENGNRLPEWDIRQTGASLDIAQNKNRMVSEAHNELVQSYIDSI